MTIKKLRTPSLSENEFVLDQEVALGLFDLLKYLKHDNLLKKLFDTEHNNDLHSSAISAVTALIRAVSRFFTTETYNHLIKSKIKYILQANNKGIVMPNYEISVWYLELLSQFTNRQNCQDGKSDYFNQEIFPLLWENFPEYKVLDDRTMYLLDRFFHLIIFNLDDQQSLKFMDRILSSLIVRMKLPIGKSSQCNFSTSSITSSEISNFGSYTLILTMLASKISTLEGMQKIVDFFKSVSNFFYVTNADKSSTKTGTLLFNLLNDFSRKIHGIRRKELFPRQVEKDLIPYPELSVEKIDMYIDITLDLINLSLFSSYNEFINDTIHYLATVRPNKILPYIWKKIFHSMNTYTNSGEQAVALPIMKTAVYSILPTLYHEIDEDLLINMIEAAIINIDPKNAQEKTNLALSLLTNTFGAIGSIRADSRMGEVLLDFMSHFFTILLPDYEIFLSEIDNNHEADENQIANRQVKFSIDGDKLIAWNGLVGSWLCCTDDEMLEILINKITRYLTQNIAEKTFIFVMNSIGSLPFDTPGLDNLVDKVLNMALDLVQPVLENPPDSETPISKSTRYGFKLILELISTLKWHNSPKHSEIFFNFLNACCQLKMSDNLILSKFSRMAVSTTLLGFFQHYDATLLTPLDYTDEKNQQLQQQVTKTSDTFPHVIFKEQREGMAKYAQSSKINSPELNLKVFPFRAYSVQYEKYTAPRNEFLSKVYLEIFKPIENCLLEWANFEIVANENQAENEMTDASEGPKTGLRSRTVSVSADKDEADASKFTILSKIKLSKKELKQQLKLYTEFAAIFCGQKGYKTQHTETHDPKSSSTLFNSHSKFPILPYKHLEEEEIDQILVPEIGNSPRTHFYNKFKKIINRLVLDHYTQIHDTRRYCLSEIYNKFFCAMCEEGAGLPYNDDLICTSRHTCVYEMADSTSFLERGVSSLLGLLCMNDENSNRLMSLTLPYDNIFLPDVSSKNSSWLVEIFWQMVHIGTTDVNKTIRQLSIENLGAMADFYGKFMFEDIIKFLTEFMERADSEDDHEMVYSLSDELLPGILATFPFRTMIAYLPKFFKLKHFDRLLGSWQDIFSNACLKPLQTHALLYQANILSNNPRSDFPEALILSQYDTSVQNKNSGQVQPRTTLKEYYTLLKVVLEILCDESYHFEATRIQCAIDILSSLINWSLSIDLPFDYVNGIFHTICKYALDNDLSLQIQGFDVLTKLMWIYRDQNKSSFCKKVAYNDDLIKKTVNVGPTPDQNEKVYFLTENIGSQMCEQAYNLQEYMIEDKVARSHAFMNNFEEKEVEVPKEAEVKVYFYGKDHEWPRAEYLEKFGGVIGSWGRISRKRAPKDVKIQL